MKTKNGLPWKVRTNRSSLFAPFLSTHRNLVDINSKFPEIRQSKNENFVTENFLQITGVCREPCCQYFSSFLRKIFWSLSVSNVAIFSTTDIVLTFFYVVFFSLCCFLFDTKKGVLLFEIFKISSTWELDCCPLSHTHTFTSAYSEISTSHISFRFLKCPYR